MEHNDEELRLAPLEDEELGLAPIEDENAQKTIAPDIPYNTGTRLIPVICSACKTRLYAGEDQVGLWKCCPDCGRLTEILAVAPKFILTANDPETAGGYDIQEPEVSNQDIFRLKAENQKSLEEYREQQNQHRIENRLPPPVFIDQPPIMEGVLNHLLKSRKEKKEENTAIRQQQEIEKETEAIKKAVRDGTLESYLAGSENDSDKTVDSVTPKPVEKQPPLEPVTSTSSPQVLPPPLPPPLPPTLTVFPPPLPPEVPSATVPSAAVPSATPSVTVSSTTLRFPADSERLPSSSRSHSSGSRHLSGSLWSPLFDTHCRSRMIILTLCGVLGNFTGEKARSMIWQIVFDRVYGQSAGYSYNLMESGFFLINFWFGAILSVVWLSMLFLFGISLFLETASGKDRVEYWIPFDLDFGFSYIGWSCLLLFVSGFPGFIIWQGASFFLPDRESILIVLHFMGQFLCFPILFLCVIESDTFYGNFPRQTLTSLYQYPLLWLQLYAKAIILVSIPIVIPVGLLFAGIAWEKHWFMQSVFYYFIAAILLTFGGYFVLLYFRLLGKTAWEIRLRHEEE
ncbi:MAG: hypothetical protein LBC20_08255 [Planctomycetaceae bacterium]|jgi:hypothetical protein|nr:hypothetical protein [Planctomycetaceae bacterium]